MILKKKKPIPDTMASAEFGFALEYVKQYIDQETDAQNKIVFLEFVLEVIRNDLKYDLLSHILYSKEHFIRKFRYPLPLFYYDEANNEKLIRELGKVEIDLAEDCVLVLPWNRGRFYSKIISIKNNDFVNDKSNHRGYYYPYLGLCTIYNGTHSISSGIIHKKGTIEVTAVDITELFPHIYTNGQYWCSTYDNKKVNVADFRLAILYEVAKIKHQIENQNKESESFLREA